VQNVSFSSLFSRKYKDQDIQNYNFACGCETWSVTLREEHRLRVFENRVLRKICRPKRGELIGDGENYIMRSLMVCTPY
jgi:hypothetical protein